jgi:hypothetical protein
MDARFIILAWFYNVCVFEVRGLVQVEFTVAPYFRVGKNLVPDNRAALCLFSLVDSEFRFAFHNGF